MKLSQEVGMGFMLAKLPRLEQSEMLGWLSPVSWLNLQRLRPCTGPTYESESAFNLAQVSRVHAQV